MYASIHSPGGRCAFLADGLCSIQQRLGGDYLGQTCATFPRILNIIGNRTERSLDLSCPEAARLALLDPKPMDFGGAFPAKGQIPHCEGLIIKLLQNRDDPVRKRLILVGHACDEWGRLEVSAASAEIRTRFIEGFTVVAQSKWDGCVRRHPDPATQLATALELMVARLQWDYTSPRYLDLYREFAAGLRLQTEATWQERGSLYAEDAAALLRSLSHSARAHTGELFGGLRIKTMFPFGLPSVDRILNLLTAGRDTTGAISTYGVLLFCRANRDDRQVRIYETDFWIEHVVRSIQSLSKTMEHSEHLPPRLLEILANKGITDSSGMATLIQDQRNS